MEKMLEAMDDQIRALSLSTGMYLNDVTFRTQIEDSERVSSQMSQSTQKMVDLTASVLDIVKENRQDSQATLNSVRSGNARLSELVGQMVNIENMVEQMGETVTSFLASTKTINRLAVRVQDIAKQTNLLALNAAIEAARAGEHGRGFAVVADEVKKLAQNSAAAAHDIQEAASGIDTGTTEVGQAVKEAMHQVHLGNDALETVAEVLGEANVSAQETLSNLGILEEHNRNGQEAVSALTDAIQGTRTIMENFTGFFHQIMGQMDGLRAEIDASINTYAQGDIPQEILLTLAKADHVRWVGRVLEAIAGKDLQLKPEELTDHHACRLGKWMDGPGQEQFGNLPEFVALAQIHPEVHVTGKAIIADFRAGNAQAVSTGVERLQQLSTSVQEKLDTLRERVLSAKAAQVDAVMADENSKNDGMPVQNSPKIARSVKKERN